VLTGVQNFTNMLARALLLLLLFWPTTHGSVHCAGEWGDWQPCTNGFRIREKIVNQTGCGKQITGEKCGDVGESTTSIDATITANTTTTSIDDKIAANTATIATTKATVIAIATSAESKYTSTFATSTTNATTTTAVGTGNILTDGVIIAAFVATGAIAATAAATAVGVAAVTGAGATAAGAGAAAIGAGATAATGAGVTAATGAGVTAATGAGVTAAGSQITPVAVVIAGSIVVASGATGGAIGAGALLYKYGLKAKALHQTNIMSPETSAKKMRSNDILRVKHAPDMNLLETVRHFTYLLSKQNIQSIKMHAHKEYENLKREIKELSQDAMAENIMHGVEVNKAGDQHMLHDCSFTAKSAAQMLRERTPKLTAIGKYNRNKVFDKATRCLEWARDHARPSIPGAESMTNDQAAAIMLYTQVHICVSNIAI